MTLQICVQISVVNGPVPPQSTKAVNWFVPNSCYNMTKTYFCSLEVGLYHFSETCIFLYLS